MPHVVTYTKVLRIDNLIIWKDENDEIKVSINVRLATETEDITRYSKICDLTPEQKAVLVNFVKSRVQELGTELDVEIPEWAQEVS